MKLRWWQISCCALVVLLVTSVVWSRWFGPEKPVNILLVTLDTTRADRLGCYGYSAGETPNLDALAKRGVLFERAYAPAPMTLPSHASMFTGLWPPEHGITTNGQASLKSGIPTLAELIREQGYDTAAFVSAFVLLKRFGLDRGFDLYDDDLSTSVAGGDELHRSRDGRYTIESAIRWLTRHEKQTTKKPFCCWVHLYDPHEPYLPHPEEFGERFASEPYDGDIAYTDRLVGRLLDSLKKSGALHNTLVVIVGDHGESLGEHGEKTHGYTLHESTLRVPLIVAHPRQSSTGRRVSTPVPLIDLFPTLLEAAGAKVPDQISGQGFLPGLSGKPLNPRICYSQTDEPYLQAFWSPLRGLTTERWRYVRTTKPELYDLIADPKEQVNLAETESNVLEELDAQLAEFEAKLKRNTGSQVALSAKDRRALESLGYTGGRSNSQTQSNIEKLPDIKDMIVHLNHLDESLHLIEHKQYDAAAVLLEPLATNVPNLLRARLNLGLCRLMQQNYEDAARWLNATLELDPECDRAHDMLGFTYLKQRKLDLAEAEFKQLLKLRPDSETGHLFLGEVYQRQGNLPLAMQYYLTVQRLNPRNQSARDAIESIRQALQN